MTYLMPSLSQNQFQEFVIAAFEVVRRVAISNKPHESRKEGTL